MAPQDDLTAERAALEKLIRWAEDVTKDWCIDDDSELEDDLEMIVAAKLALDRLASEGA